jgi:hypothetical protein
VAEGFVGRLGLEFSPYVTQVGAATAAACLNLYELFVCFVERLGLEFNPYVTQVRQQLPHV